MILLDVEIQRESPHGASARLERLTERRGTAYSCQMATIRRPKDHRSVAGYGPACESLAAFFDLESAAPILRIEDIHRSIVEGELHAGLLREFRLSTGLTIDEVAGVTGMSARTVSRKEEQQKSLSVAEGDRAMRLATVARAAVEAIGSREKAIRWLRKPNAALRGEKPLTLIESEPGTQLVLAALDRIAYGGVT
jgi:putative toxin-antitoxin system antitoxin component (TIGR02293 family)